MDRAIPILFVADLSAACAFYVEWLGFGIDWEFRFDDDYPAYVQISRGGIVLHLSEHVGDNPPGVKCHIEVDDLDALVAEWNVKRSDFVQRPRIEPWNAKHLRIKDPFGNELGFNQSLAEKSN